MARYRAVIKGARGSASRLGHKTSGISTLLQTWGWDVRVSAWAANDERDVAVVEMVNHNTGEKRKVAFLDLTSGINQSND